MSRTPSTPGADGAARRDSNCPARPNGSDAPLVPLLERIATAVEALRDRAAPPDVLTAPDLAALLRVDVRTLRAMRRGGELPRGFLVGRSPRWRRSTIDAWMERQR